MNKNKYEYPLPIGTIIVGGFMSSTTDRERYQYQVDEILGQGGFGITYKVSAKIKIGNVWQKQRVTFAIKEHFVKGHCYRGNDGVTVEYSKASANEVEDSLKDFLKEGERLGKICSGCDNIVNVNEVIQTNNTAYYVMEFIDGGDLRKYGQLDEKTAVKYICQIANAVDFIHRQKVLHLDIKPENIVLTQNPDGDLVPILIDFGVARYFSPKGGLTTTHKDAAASEGYAPQEQYAGVKTFAPEIDVYALGATLFYMLVGRAPHSAFNRTPGDVEKALPDSISEQTKEALVNAMKVQAFERTKTVVDFLSELKNQKEEYIPHSSERDDTKNQTLILPKDRNSKNKKVFVGILVGVVLLTGVVMLSNKSSQPVSPETIQTDSIITEEIDIEASSNDQIPINDEADKPKTPEDKKENVTGNTGEPKKTQEPKDTDEDIYNRALQTNDWGTMEALARKGYTPACGALAWHYVPPHSERTTENLSQAYFWAQKASKNDRDDVMEILKRCGFILANGKPYHRPDERNPY